MSRSRVVWVLAWISMSWIAATCADPQAPVVAPEPLLSALIPDSVLRGRDRPPGHLREGLRVVLVGSHFHPESVVRWNELSLPTEYISGRELRVTLLGNWLIVEGTNQMSVFTPGPGGGTSDALPFRSVGHPTPALDSISPRAAPYDAGDLALTVYGDAFRPISSVRWNDSGIQTAYIDEQTLEAIIPSGRLQAGGPVGITVATATSSAALPFVVESPLVPELSSLSPTSALLESSGIVLTVSGDGFASTSVIRWDGEDLDTQVNGPTDLETVIPDDLLLVPGSVDVVVFTPGPDAGESVPLSFEVVDLPPVLALLSSEGVNSGNPGFDLMLHGARFSSGAVVNWNGVTRAATFVSDTRLSVPVGAADVAVAGTAEVSVIDLLGRESEVLEFEVRDLGAATADVTRLPLVGRDLAWDPVGGRIYVTIPGAAPAIPNTVAAVDPYVGSIEGSVEVGDDPRRIAISDDGQYVYVGLDGENGVRRVDLATLTAGLQWSLAFGEVAMDIAVVPGQAGTVAIAKHQLSPDDRLMGVTMYDDGSPRPQSTQPAIFAVAQLRVAFLDDPSTLYASERATLGGQPFNPTGFYTLEVSAAGVRVLHRDGLLEPYDMEYAIVGANGRVYHPGGFVIDAEQRVGVGQFPVDGAVAPDPTTGRVFFLSETGVAVYDMNTFGLLGTLPIAGISEAGGRLVRWGDDGLAFLDADELFLVRSPVVAP